MRVTDEQLALEKTMPHTPHGQIVNPFYVPQTSWEAAYLREWGEWCRATPRSQWPIFIVEYVKHRQREKEKKAGGVGGIGGRERTEAEGPEVRDELSGS